MNTETRNDLLAVCCRRDAGLTHGRHEIGQAVLAMFPRRERAQAVAEREAQARRRIQVRIRACPLALEPYTPRHLSCVLYHISETMTYAGPAPDVAINSYHRNT